MTANDLIQDALTEIQVYDSADPISASDSQLAFRRLQNMMDSFQAESLMIFTTSRIVLDVLTQGVQSFTLGPGGFFNATCPYRPAQIDRYGILNLNNPSQPLELPLNEDGTNLTQDEWAQIPVKAVQSSLPLYCWDDGGFPLRTLSFWCIPTAPVQPVIYPWVPLSQFVDLTTDYTFPPGYAECIMYQLALRLTGPFDGKITPALAQMANEAKARIKSFNLSVPLMRVDPMMSGVGHYDWRSDTFTRTLR